MTSFVIAARTLLAGVFLLSGVSKSKSRTDFDAFVASVRDLALVRFSAAMGVARAVIGAELAIALMLVVGVSERVSFALAAALLAVYCATIAVVIRRGGRTSCRCLGASALPLGPWHLVRNGALIAVAVAASAVPPTPEPSAAELVVAVAVAVAVLGHVVYFDDLVEAFSASRERELERRIE
jgi:hypothetical protein